MMYCLASSFATLVKQVGRPKFALGHFKNLVFVLKRF